MGEKEYLGLANVFHGEPGKKKEVSTAMVEVNEEVSAFLARPKLTIKYPGILMIHEWWGLNDQIKSMAHTLAREGYAVLAPDLFSGRVATSIEEGKANVEENPIGKTFPRLVSALEFLRSLDMVEPGNIGSVGWCFGGALSCLVGAEKNLQAVAIYYGNLTDDKDVLEKLKSPILGIFGAEDIRPSVGEVRKFESVLREQGTPVEIHVYEGAGHAFANPTQSTRFREEQAKDAWTKTIDFFAQTLNRS